jgi:hypothetical protein
VNSAEPGCCRNIGPWTVAILVTALTSFGILFTTWAAYDDEGYILWTLIHHARGHVLYEDIYTQYGPAFYLLDSGFRAILPIPYSSDGQRWQTWLFWLATSLLLLRSFHKLAATNTNSNSSLRPSLIGSMILFLLAFWHQERLALEPGHPQIWCTLLVATSILIFASKANTTTPLPSWSLTSLIGLIAGTLIMIKPNVGILLLAALPAPYLWSNLPSRRWLSFLDAAYTVGLIAIPWLLTYKQLNSLDTFYLPALVTASLIGIRVYLLGVAPVVSDTKPHDTHRVAHLACLTLSLAACLAFFVLWSSQRGVSPLALKQALFGQHGSLLELYFFPAIRSALGLTGLGVLAALFLYQLGAKWSKIRSDFRQKTEPSLSNSGNLFISCFLSFLPNRTHWSFFFIAVSAVAMAAIWFDALTPLAHGLRPRGCAELLLALAPAIAIGWLSFRLPAMAVQTKTDGDSTSRTNVRLEPDAQDGACALAHYPYIAIAIIASLQPLIAFPVPGTQLSLGTLPLLLLTVDGCSLAVAHLRTQAHYSNWLTKNPRRIRYYRWFAYAIAIIPVALLMQRYMERDSLNLPGATLLRLPDSERTQTQELISAIRKQQADAIVFRWHNRPTWYLWAQAEPPYSQLPPSWTYLVSADQQTEQLQRLRKLSKVLVIDEDYAPQRPPPASPLHQAWKSAEKSFVFDSDFSLHLWLPN